jgi:hypothetical protein
MTSELEEVRECLLALLPADGAPITNRAARAMIAKQLARHVSAEAYFQARDHLLSENVVGRVRGQGGSVFLLDDSPPPTPEQLSKPLPQGPSERELMNPFGIALSNSFTSGLDLPRGSPPPVIEDISAKGPRRGVWARPDYVLVSISQYSVLPGVHVDTHVFELKNELGGGLKAVHEALAQARFANFAHFVWHVPDGSLREPELDEVVSHCTLHGVGFLRLRTAPEPSVEVLADARRTSTTRLEVDGFLESRLSAENRLKLAAAIKRSDAS